MTTCAVSHLSVSRLPAMEEGDITDIFSHFAHQSWAMLLDSANAQHGDSRYDILVANPVATCTFAEGKTCIWHAENDDVNVVDKEPLDALDTLMDEYIGEALPDTVSDLPFKVGALGYWGYDFGRQIEDLPESAVKDCCAPDMAVGIYTWSVIRDNHNGSMYLCALTDHPHPSVEEIKALYSPKASGEKFALVSPWQSNLKKNEYIQRLARIRDYLVAGDCYQVNMAQRFTAQYEGNEWHAYLRLRQSNKAPFSAFIRLPDQCILSISPERFLSLKDSKVETKPIKGTRPRADDPKADELLRSSLRQSEKDCAENLMIVDLLRNDLSKSCLPGSVKVPELFAIESFAAVHHLVSTVTAKLAPHNSGLDLLRNAFPGGSITGAPKVRAMEIIDELEPHRRNIYCGSIGYLGIHKDMDTSICIRTLLCENNAVHCWAGGGIVVDSQPDAEYQECLDKVSKILPVLSGVE